MYATFMAKPMEGEPGSAMHMHQSLVDEETGHNLFTAADGKPTSLFYELYRRLAEIHAGADADLRAVHQLVSPPVALHGRADQRARGVTTTARWASAIPHSGPAARRIENRIPGVDCNPYLAIAATLASGYLGMTQKLEATEPLLSDGYELPYQLPRNLEEGLTLMGACEPIAEVLGEKFVKAYLALKETEYEAFFRVISSWERRHLLLHV